MHIWKRSLHELVNWLLSNAFCWSLTQRRFSYHDFWPFFFKQYSSKSLAWAFHSSFADFYLALMSSASNHFGCHEPFQWSFLFKALIWCDHCKRVQHTFWWEVTKQNWTCVQFLLNAVTKSNALIMYLLSITDLLLVEKIVLPTQTILLL